MRLVFLEEEERWRSIHHGPGDIDEKLASGIEVDGVVR